MSNKRPATDALEYAAEEGHQAKKFKVAEPQIVASNQEIEERMAKMIDARKNSQGATQVQGILQADAAVIAAAKAAHQPRTSQSDSSSTSGKTDANASNNETTITYSERLPPGLPDVVEDRLSTLERKLYTNFSIRAVPRDVYSRLKALEDRVLQLEKAGALQQREAEMAAATATTVELRPQIEAAVPESVDDRIKELQSKLLAQNAQS